jgi:hypothetical protein
MAGPSFVHSLARRRIALGWIGRRSVPRLVRREKDPFLGEDRRGRRLLLEDNFHTASLVALNVEVKAMALKLSVVPDRPARDCPTGAAPGMRRLGETKTWHDQSYRAGSTSRGRRRSRWARWRRPPICYAAMPDAFILSLQRGTSVQQAIRTGASRGKAASLDRGPIDSPVLGTSLGRAAPFARTRSPGARARMAVGSHRGRARGWAAWFRAADPDRMVAERLPRRRVPGSRSTCASGARVLTRRPRDRNDFPGIERRTEQTMETSDLRESGCAGVTDPALPPTARSIPPAASSV